MSLGLLHELLIEAQAKELEVNIGIDGDDFGPSIMLARVLKVDRAWALLTVSEIMDGGNDCAEVLVTRQVLIRIDKITLVMTIESETPLGAPRNDNEDIDF
jgi:hypothetical protein